MLMDVHIIRARMFIVIKIKYLGHVAGSNKSWNVVVVEIRKCSPE